MLKRVYIHNYKRLVGLELELTEIVLLLGGNGSGKTAVLDALFGLRELLSGAVRVTDRVAFHPSTLTRWQNQRHQVFELDVDISGECLRYHLKVEHDTDRRQSRIVKETLTTSAGVSLFECELGTVQLYRDDGSEGQTPPILDRYTGNFVDWYRHVLQENPMSAASHGEALCAVIEGFVNIHLQQSGLDSRALMLDLVVSDTGSDINSRHYRLRFDEPDNYLALQEIQPWLMELLTLCEDTTSQAVICSHNPELINYLGPNCGLFLQRGESAITTTQPADAIANDSSLTLSELIARG